MLRLQNEQVDSKETQQSKIPGSDLTLLGLEGQQEEVTRQTLETHAV